VDIDWRDGKLLSATLRSRHGGTARVRYGERFSVVHINAGQRMPFHAQDFRQRATTEDTEHA
jgi:hypothetical protein